MNLQDFWLRLRALILPRRAERDLHDELGFHLEMQTRKHLAAGMEAAEAQRLARAQFGSTALIEDRVRDARGIRFFETLLQDLRYAIRSFRRAPTFALTVIGTIALGLGLNTAVFTIFNAYVLKPFAVRDPYSLYQFEQQMRSGQWRGLTWQQYERFRQNNPVFSEMFAERHQIVTRIEGHVSYALLVTGNYFRMLGVEAVLGRTLEPSDSETPGGKSVAVISYDLWQRQFGGNPAVLGRTILIQGFPCEIVGVARAGFNGLDQAPPHDLWLPITLDHQLEDGPDLFGPEQPPRVGVVGRLKPGVTKAAAEAALRVWAEHEAAALPSDAQTPAGGHHRILQSQLQSRATTIPLSPMVAFALSPIAVAFALVLLIACANVANMMLARGLARQREIGIRLTLGAGRQRLIAQMLVESITLAVPGAALGFAISRVAIDVSVRIMFATLPSEYTEFIRVAPLPPDARVFAFMVAAAIATGVVFGMVPALQATRRDVVQMARGDFQWDFGPSRLRHALVVAQITASVMLLITAAVLVRSARRVSLIEPGVRTRDIISLDIREPARPAIVAALKASPVVTMVAVASTIPLDGMAPGIGVAADDHSDLTRVGYRFVSPSFFDLFDIPIVRGRNFTGEEAKASAPVAVISESLATKLWPNATAVGRTIRFVHNPAIKPSARPVPFDAAVVVGVARDTSVDLGQRGPALDAVHLPVDITAANRGLVVRVNGEPEASRRALDVELEIAAPGAVQEIHKVHEFVSGRLYPYRAAYWVAGAVGALALLLTLSGVYGVLSYLVTQRAKEISIRMALGAGIASVVSLVLRQSMRLTIAGAALGALLALAAGRVFAARIPMVDTFDQIAYVAGTIVVIVACLLAASVPALRAARMDPMTTLRAD